MPETNENYPRRTETFDVVLLKEGKHPGNAEPADYKRVTVTAESPLAAILDKAVGDVKGFAAQCAVPPGTMTDGEINARRRQMDPPVDKSKI